MVEHFQFNSHKTCCEHEEPYFANFWYFYDIVLYYQTHSETTVCCSKKLLSKDKCKKVHGIWPWTTTSTYIFLSLQRAKTGGADTIPYISKKINTERRGLRWVAAWPLKPFFACFITRAFVTTKVSNKKLRSREKLRLLRSANACRSSDLFCWRLVVKRPRFLASFWKEAHSIEQSLKLKEKEMVALAIGNISK